MCSIMSPLKIGDIEVKIPIIQGGMGVSISLAGLAAAVANEGGIGVISAAGAGMMESDFKSNFINVNRNSLKIEIQKARKMTKWEYVAIGLLSLFLMVFVGMFSMPFVLNLIIFFGLSPIYLAEPILVILCYLLISVLGLNIASKTPSSSKKAK